MKHRLIHAYQSGEALVLVSRDEKGARVYKHIRAEYVAYLKAAQVEETLLRSLRTSRHVVAVQPEGEWLKVAFRDRFAREELCLSRESPLAAMGVASFEADVQPVYRWIADNEVELQKPRRVFLDIETDSRKTFKQAKEGEARVLSWALVDDDRRLECGVLATDTNDAERELLQALWDALGPYDQVLAWNGDLFDYPVIFARSALHRIRANAYDWLWLDHLALFLRMNTQAAESGEEKQSMRLQDVATAILGEGKLDEVGIIPGKSLGAQTWEMWEAGGEHRARLLRYNIVDTDRLRGIEQKTGYADLFATLCEVCAVFGNTDGLNPTRQMDGFMLRLGRERNHRFASKRFNEGAAKFKGAYVMEPKLRGVERDVHVVDFASLYPSIIITWNMSPETKVSAPVNGPIPEGTCRSPLTGISFRTDVDGILPTALREMIRMRKFWADKKASLPPGTEEWKDADRKSTAYKVAANSFYGVMGSPFSRFFDRQVAESVTQNGQWLIKQTIAAAEERGWEGIYADTDSVFVKGVSREEFAAFTDWCNAELYPRILAGVGCKENRIKLAYEKQFARIVMPMKKRYIGSFVHYKGKEAVAGSKPEIKGLEYKRGDSLRLARQLQAHVIDLLVGGLGIDDGPVPTDDLERYHAVLSRARSHVLNDPLPVEEIRQSKALSRELGGYAKKTKLDGTDAAQPPHVTVARILEQRGQQVSEGTRIEYVVADGDVSPLRAIPADDYDGSNADRYYVWESLVFPATQRLLEAAYPEHDWKSWAKVRPPKPRGRARVAANQMALPATTPVLVTNNIALPPAAPAKRRAKGPLTLVMPMSEAEAKIAELRAVLDAAPGEREVRLVLVRDDGAEAELQLEQRVSASATLLPKLAAAGVKAFR